jgi:hypothetical protein
MKSNLPLAFKPKRLVHSRLIPAWRDAFDLRTYFACIEPGQYELKDQAELEPAKQLFADVQQFSVKWVMIYRAMVRALPNHEEILEPAMTCLESFLYSDRSSHLTWNSSPQTGFDGKAPEDWFVDCGLPELAGGLRFYAPVEQSDLKPEVPLQDRTGHGLPVILLRQTAAEGERLLNSDQRELLPLLRSLFSPDEWEDEFDLAPYFAALVV